MHPAASTSAPAGTQSAVARFERSDTSPTTQPDGAVPSMCIVKMTSPCAETASRGGARSSTLAAIGAWYQDITNRVVTPTA